MELPLHFLPALLAGVLSTTCLISVLLLRAFLQTTTGTKLRNSKITIIRDKESGASDGDKESGVSDGDKESGASDGDVESGASDGDKESVATDDDIDEVAGGIDSKDEDTAGGIDSKDEDTAGGSLSYFDVFAASLDVPFLVMLCLLGKQ